MDLALQIDFAAYRLRQAILREGVYKILGTPEGYADARTSSQDAATALLLVVHEQYQLEV